MSELLDFLLLHEDNFRRVRLPSLYSDFRSQRAINPDGYKSNLSAWKSGLTHAARAGLIPGGKDILLLRTGESLLQALETRELGRPLALTPVIVAAVEEGHMIPLPDFLNSPTSIYERKGAGPPWSLVSWALRQIGLIRVQSIKLDRPKGSYVLVENVEEVATEVIRAMNLRLSRIDRVVPMKMFAAEVAKTLDRSSALTDDDLRILLVYLSRDKSYLAYNAQVVKLRGRGERSPELTIEDTNIASLKSLVADLNVQLETLTLKMAELDHKVRSAVANKNRAMALASLRSKKLYESISLRRSETLSQLEGICIKIEEASDQVEVMDVMKASSNVLKRLNAEIGGVETVEEVLDELRNEMNQVSEIGAIVSEAAQATSMVDDDSVDEELEALERQDQARSEEEAVIETKKRLELLDMVPSGLAMMLKESVVEKLQPEALDESTHAVGRLSIDSDETRAISRKRSQELAKPMEAQQTS
ncbi:hypothetical protein MMC11_007252 [Xylographa trunciseda]|nr:hypothetical protein [Xylographa trunciseda]